MRGNDSLSFVIYEPFGDRLDLYPEVKSADIGVVYGSPGDNALSMSVNKRAHGGQYLDVPHEVAIEVNGKEVDDCRFLVVSTSSDLAEQAEGVINLTGYNYDFLLTKAKVIRPAGYTPANRIFEGMSPGRIMRILLGEAKPRGWGDGVYVDFNPTSADIGTDSNGKTWSVTIDHIEIEFGTDLLSVLKHFVEAGWCDAGWQGRNMRMYSPNTVDYQNKETMIVLGQDIESVPIQSSWADYASAVWVYGKELTSDAGPDQHQRTRTVGADGIAPPWGRWEGTADYQSFTGTSTLNYLGDKFLDANMRRKHQYTVGLKFAERSPLPFVNYKHGDWIYLGVKQPPEYLRIRQITLSLQDSGGWGGNLVMNDRFLETELRVLRAVRKITGGKDVLSGV